MINTINKIKEELAELVTSITERAQEHDFPMMENRLWELDFEMPEYDKEELENHIYDLSRYRTLKEILSLIMKEHTENIKQILEDMTENINTFVENQMPDKGDSCEISQKMCLINSLNDFEHKVNGITSDDFICLKEEDPNEYAI